MITSSALRGDIYRLLDQVVENGRSLTVSRNKVLKICRVEPSAKLARRIGLTLCDLPFATVMVESIAQSWTRDDPFDRLITAQAISRNAPLLTKDRHIADICNRGISVGRGTLPDRRA